MSFERISLCGDPGQRSDELRLSPRITSGFPVDLPWPQQVHRLNAFKCAPRRVIALEALWRPHSLPDGSVILLAHIVQLFTRRSLQPFGTIRSSCELLKA